ncbi:NACHT and WD repeat domain-containing protein [Geodermatophilus sp. SYSU D01105]
MTAPAPPRVGDPYVGPVSFRAGDPLYGRDGETQDLLDLLIAERIVLLYSPSGAGKTSLIEAALVPALREAGFEVLPTIRVTHALEPEPGGPTPRNRYVMSVLLSLEEGVPPERQRPVAELATLTLHEYVAANADRDGRPGNEVLVFDQFEEALTADPTDEEAKHQFFRELGQLLRDRDHWALFSMREDFLAALDPYLRYLPTRFRSTFRLDLLSVSEALEAIRLPAQRMGVVFTEDAAQQLVDDLRTVRVQRPGGVTEVLGSYVEPVQLQVACHLLWSTLPPDATEITRADVEALGRVDQALADYYAERVRTAADRTGVLERVIREWFEEDLITPQGLRSQVLQGPEPSTDAGHHLLAELLDAHLVRAETRRQATWYELAHDRLIEPVRRDNAAWRAQHLSSFERAAVLWEEEGKPDRLLLLGADLAAAEQEEAVRTGALTARQQEFLQASRRADEQARRDMESAAALRRSARRLKVAVALVTLLAIAAVVLYVESVAARDRAEDEEAQSALLYEAQRDLASDHPRAVALAASVAESNLPEGLNVQTRDLLYLAAESPVSLVLRGQRGPVRAAAFSEDERVLVAADGESIQLWDRRTGEPSERLELEDGDVVNSVDVSQDAGTVVAGLADGTLLVWEVGTDEPRRWPDGTSTVWSVDLSPDGTRIASVGQSDQVRLWDLDGRQHMQLAIPGALEAYYAAYSPDGRSLATSSDVPEVILWDAATGAQTGRLSLPEGQGAWAVAFGLDTGTLATMTPGAVTVWDVSTGTPLHPPLDAAESVYQNVSADLSQALLVDPYGGVTVYDMATGGAVASASSPGASLCCAGFDVDVDRVLVLPESGSPVLWDLEPTYGYESAAAAAVAGDSVFTAWTDGVLRHRDGQDAEDAGRVVPGVDANDVAQLTADASGDRVVAVTGTGEIRGWETTTGAEVTWPQPVNATFSDADLTADGRVLVTGDTRGRVVVWDAATGQELDEVVAAQSYGVDLVEVSPDASWALTTTGSLVQATEADAAVPGPGPDARLVSLTNGGADVSLWLPESAAGTTTAPDVITAAAFSPDRTLVFTGSSEGRVTAFDVATGDVRWTEDEGLEGSVIDMTVTGDGVLATSTSRAVLLDAAGGGPLREIPSESYLLTSVLISGGDQIALVASDGVRTLPMRDRDLVDLVGSKVAHELTDEECESYRLDAGC